MTPLVVIGASLGGLDALGQVLGGLPVDLPAAVAVVQHRTADYDSRLEQLLQARCAMPVQKVQDKDGIDAGRIYFAPGDYHLLIDGSTFALALDEPVSWARPSIDVLFESAADSAHRPLIGVLLSASSEDGARGIEAIARSGGVTIVQDPKEAVSPVGPLAAIGRTKVSFVLPLPSVPPRVVSILGRSTAARS